MNFVYVQGKLLNEAESAIKITDRSFRYGDGVFERIRVQNNKFLNFPFHEKRLRTGLDKLKIQYSTNNLRESCEKVLAKNKATDAMLRIHISRGEGSRGYMPANSQPVMIITAEHLPHEAKPAKVFISSYPSYVPIRAKTGNSLNYVLSMLEADENKFDNSILLDAAGNICECANGNIFWVKNGKLFTPTLTLPLIPGSVQNVIMREFAVTQAEIGLDGLVNQDEIFMTNTSVITQNMAEIKGIGVIKSEGFAAKVKDLVLNSRNFG